MDLLYYHKALCPSFAFMPLVLTVKSCRDRAIEAKLLNDGTQTAPEEKSGE